MEHANDNIRDEIWDDDGFRILEEWHDFKFLRALRGKLPACLIDNGEMVALKNFLWFVRFEHGFKEDAVREKREQIKLVE